MSEIYYVISWETGEILKEFDKIGRAKRYARGLGHDGKDNPILVGYAPIAYVGNEKKEVIYNPYFGKRISTAAGQLVESYDKWLVRR